MLALGAASVDGVQASELAVVHAGVVAFTNPNSAGFAAVSVASANALNWMTLRPALPMAAFSVELKSVDSPLKSACPCGPCEAASGVLPMSGRFCTTTYCAPAALSLPTAVARSSAACETAAWTWAGLAWYCGASWKMSLAPPWIW